MSMVLIRCAVVAALAFVALVIALLVGSSTAVAGSTVIPGDVAGSDLRLLNGARLTAQRVRRVRRPAGAVVLAVRVSGARRTGQVTLGPAGGKLGSAIAYRRDGVTTATAVVKLGRQEKLAVRASGGAPRVSIRATGWFPKTSSVVVPPLARSVTRRGKRFTKLGPAGADAVILAVTTTGARRAGTLSLANGAAVASYGRGRNTAIVLAAPSSDGSVTLTARGGKPKLSARLVGWSSAGGQLTAAPAPKVVGTLGGPRKLRLRGRGGIPASSVRSAVVSAQSAAGSLLQVVELDRAGRGRVVSPGGRAKVVAVGWVADPGGAKVSYDAKPGTVVLAAGDVISAGPRSLVLDRTATVPPRGGHVFAAVPGEAGSAVGRVDDVTRERGRTVLAVSGAPLEHAFERFDVKFDGPTAALASAQAVRASRRTHARASALTTSIPVARKEIVACAIGAGVPLLTDLSLDLEDNNVHFDFNLADRLIDFGIRGRFVAHMGMTGGSTDLKCSLGSALTDKLELPILLPGTPFKLRVGPVLSLSAKAPTEASLTGIARFAAGFSYIDGQSSSYAAAGLGGDVTKPPESLTLKAGAQVSVGPAVVFEAPIEVDPRASIGIGAKVDVGEPEATAAGRLWGPRCVDVTGSGYIDIGPEVTLSFFDAKTVKWEAKKTFESERTPFYRGPCWGLVGSVVFTDTGRQWSGSQWADYNDQITIQALPGHPARYNGDVTSGMISQPLQYQGEQHVVHGYETDQGLCTTNGRDISGIGQELNTDQSLVQTNLIRYGEAGRWTGPFPNSQRWFAGGISWGFTGDPCNGGTRVEEYIQGNLAPYTLYVDEPLGRDAPEFKATVQSPPQTDGKSTRVIQMAVDLTRVEVPRQP